MSVSINASVAGFGGGGGGDPVWGDITGTLSSQTDLQAALDAKVGTTGNETVAGIKTLSSAPIISALTASKPVFSDGSKALTSTGTMPVANGGTNSTTSLNNNRVMVSSSSAIVEATAITASRALVSDSNGIPVHSNITTTQLNASLVEVFTGHIEAGSDKIYTLDEYAAYGYTINTLITKMVSGTCTISIKINGTNVTSISAHSATSSQVTSTASGANTVAAGDRVTMVLASSSSPVDLAFTLKVTRT